MKQRLFLSALFTIPLFYISMGHMMNLPLPGWLLGMENAMAFAYTQFLLLLPVLIVNSSYFKGGFRSLLKGSPNMDSIIAIGSSHRLRYLCHLQDRHRHGSRRYGYGSHLYDGSVL